MSLVTRMLSAAVGTVVLAVRGDRALMGDRLIARLLPRRPSKFPEDYCAVARITEPRLPRRRYSADLHSPGAGRLPVSYLGEA